MRIMSRKILRDCAIAIGRKLPRAIMVFPETLPVFGMGTSLAHIDEFLVTLESDPGSVADLVISYYMILLEHCKDPLGNLIVTLRVDEDHNRLAIGLLASPPPNTLGIRTNLVR
jgi:hypothetical protein